MPDFDKVREDELGEIQELRRRRGVPDGDPEHDLTGLCFSGGGIRSATFCLGVLQGLATFNLLKHFDYISSVSGGGYIACWLISWIKRPGEIKGNPTGIDAVEQELREAPPHFNQYTSPPLAEKYQEPGAINFLRSYSNYLTPRLGLFSADTWVAVASYVRNLLLNLTVLVASLGAVILIPRFLQLAFCPSLLACSRAAWITAALAVALLLFALTFVDRNVADFSLREAVAEVEGGKKPDKEQLARAGQSAVLWFGVLPLFFAAALGAWSLASFVKNDPGITSASAWWWIDGGAIGYFFSRLIAQLFAWIWPAVELRQKSQEEKDRFWKKEITTARNMLLWAPFAGILGGILLRQLSCFIRFLLCLEPRAAAAHLVSWGPPLLMAIVLLNGVLHVGLMSIRFVNQKREWWARLAAWLLIWTLMWTFIFALALFSPLGVLELSGWVKTKYAVILSWAGTTLYGVLAGKSSKTSGEKKTTSSGQELITTIAPYVFIIGALVLISYGLYAVTRNSLLPKPAAAQVEMRVTGSMQATAVETIPVQGTLQLQLSHKSGSDHAFMHAYWDSWGFWKLLVLLAVVVFIAALLGWRVDINEFSLHLFYRNRLVRCYLGATNPQRCPHPFTGFDPTDDVLLCEFATARDLNYDGPYPILNSALNISHGQRLAWQERKAESFIFTPRYCGYDFQEERQDDEPPSSPQKKKESLLAKNESYRETEKYAYPPAKGAQPANAGSPPLEPGGPYLGTAVAISGAAVNPNMGYHASAPVAFLLTVFNVRLGWWMGNPRRRDTWEKSSPLFGLFYLLCDLFGVTDDTSRYVNLSDGYHFENFGLYELVRRKCKYIVVCDVGADEGFRREDLGNAVRKCRSRFWSGDPGGCQPTPPQTQDWIQRSTSRGRHNSLSRRN
jgi:hypothetical protein